MKSSRVGLGPMGRRLLLAFVLVAVSSVLVLTAAALIGVGRGFQVAEEAGRERAATAAAAAAGDAYQKASGWEGADQSRISALAEAAGARLFVLDSSGRPLVTTSGGGHVVQGQGTGTGPVGGQGQGMGTGPVGGQGQGMGPGPVGGQGVVNAPVVVDGVSVGTVRLVFEVTGTTGRDVAWSWIAVAAVVALVVALVASLVVTRLLTRPIDAMTSAARAFAAGDREARTVVQGPGELGELAHAFDSMADTVARSERDRRNLTADVAHELRTPLAALQAGLEELRDGLAEPTPQGLAGLHDQSLRLGRVVSDLAELSAVEAAGVSPQRADVDLTEVARDELLVRDPQLRAAGLVVDSQLNGRVAVWADSDRLHQAVGNLLANTARYCRPGDGVTVIVGAEGDQAVLRVVDSGPGIAQDELPHVFDRLWRGRSAQHVTGSGIGLAVAREIVAGHGGTIEANSSEGGGATITIRIPLSLVPRPGNP